MMLEPRQLRGFIILFRRNGIYRDNVDNREKAVDEESIRVVLPEQLVESQESDGALDIEELAVQQLV